MSNSPVRLLIHGAGGRMGRMLVEAVLAAEDMVLDPASVDDIMLLTIKGASA